MSQQKTKNKIVIKKITLNKEIMFEENIVMYKGNDKIGEIDVQIINKYQFKNKIKNEIEKDLTKNEKDQRSENNIEYLKQKIEEIEIVYNIEKLYVDSKYQNQGYGTKLINLAIERYKENNKKKSLMVLTRTQIGEVKKESLSTIYEKFGFSNNIKQKNGIFMFNDLNNINIKLKNKKIDKEISNDLVLN